MNDLINRQAAIDALKKAYWDANLQSVKDDPCVIDAMTDWAIRQINDLPSAQPEIIRCKDCKHRPKRLGKGEDDGFDLEFPDYECPCRCDDEWYNWMPDDNWFCADGERKQE